MTALRSPVIPSRERGPFAIAILALVSVCLPTPALAAGSSLTSLISDIAFCLGLAGVLSVVFVRFKIPTIAAFIVAGLIAGPLGFGRITDPANIEAIAELGLILLLFTIGLEMDLKELRQGGRVIIAVGLLQFPLTVLFGYAAAKIFAVTGLFGPLLEGWLVPLYIGAAIAGSSTLLVVKLFQDSFEIDTVPGRVSLGILVFQDLWAIVLIILQPSLDAPKVMPIVGSFIGIGLLAAATVTIGRPVLKRAFAWIAKSPETIVLASIGFCFIIVLSGNGLDGLKPSGLPDDFHLTVGAGMSALIAGAVIASLPYAHEITGKVSVLKDFFVTLFFVSLGISIPAPDTWNIPILAFIIAALASISRLVIFFPLLYFAGLDRRNATVTSVRLAQISEFGLVVVVLGLELGQLTHDQASAIILAFVITALATSPLYRFAYVIHERLSPLLGQLGFKEPEAGGASGEKPPRIVLLGFHRVASALLTELQNDDPELMKEILVIDFNVALHEQLRERGVHVHYGDFSKSETLAMARVDAASIVISTVRDDLMRGVNNEELVTMVRRINPKATIIANAVRLDDVPAIYAAGATYVYAGHIEAARALSKSVERALNGELEGWARHKYRKVGALEERPDVLR